MKNLSFWERESWFTDVDHCIIGSGVTGLNAALELQRKFPESKTLVLERGILPHGASTKNAGFACFGSLSELLDDLDKNGTSAMVALVRKRWEGLKLLRENLGDETIDLQCHGGFEIFFGKEKSSLHKCLSRMDEVNALLKPIFGENVFDVVPNGFGFENICNDVIRNKFEAQIDTGKMMVALLQKAISQNILILNGQNATDFLDINNGVQINTDDFSFIAKKLFIATNGFASKVVGEKVVPARAQVLVTSPIENLKLNGTFHFDEGFYYFRNINDRVLFGGGRNLDFETERTTEFGQTELVMNSLESILKNVILPRQNFEIVQRWSGIMGVGESKNPIVEQLSENVYCGVRLGGMGVAIGSLVGKELANLIGNKC